MPAATAGEQVPAVLLLHGDLSSRDENGDMFVRLADALSARGIASLRIDFAGSGDSEEPDLDLSYPNMVDDATAALDYLAQDAAVDPTRIAVLGLSRGGSIAATVAGTVPGVAALVSWSGAVSNGVDEDPDAHQDARDNGWVTVDLGDREFRLSVAWFDTIEQSHPLDDVVGYRGRSWPSWDPTTTSCRPRCRRSSSRTRPARTRRCTSSTGPTTGSPRSRPTGTRPLP
jgi:uncharacterized protein